MDILCVCNQKMCKSLKLKAIFSEMCTIGIKSFRVKNISLFTENIIKLSNDVSLLLENKMEIVVFK